ncbi:HAD family hydrolase [Microbacterium testaceum]|uniref:HAD family hydrolase n=1 Tax=Microbacterium testaceum TaxID=2033 RepID=UPI0038FCAFC0
MLVDSEVIAVEIDRIILAEHGWHLTTEEIVDRFLGRSFSHVQASLEEHLGHTLPATWETKQASRYLEAFTKELRPVAGIEAALDAISLATCIASSGSHEKLRHTLGLTGLAPRFQGRVFSASEVTRGKPAPDLFLHAAAKMGVAPERAVVVEDSQHGVAAGLAAGMRVLGYAGGMTPEKWLEEAGAIVFYDMAQLPSLIEELKRSRTA